MTEQKRRLPAWLWGLIIAALVFAVVLVAANLLGFGDDPAIGATAFVAAKVHPGSGR